MNFVYGSSGTIGSVFLTILYIINNIFVPVLFAVAFAVFLFGVFRYFILGGDEAESHKTGAQFIMYGLIGFFVMVSVWGLVNIAVNTFGLDTPIHPPYPYL